jgi:HPt (histidine-containing phosphotransfer) domain-containing protein
MNKKQYNLDYLNSISDGDQEFIIDMVKTFIETVPEELNKIKSLIEINSWGRVGEEAHKFASNLLFFNNEELKLVAIAIEDSGTNLNKIEKIPDLFIQLESGCYEIIKELKLDFNIN